ncbi:MAG: hypothetical protein Q9204_000854 [Flavoplaca sp. TL-2023a]
MPRRTRRSNQARSTRSDPAKKVTPRLITLPNPEVLREPNGMTIRINTKTFSYTLDTVAYTYGYRLALRDHQGRHSQFNERRQNVEVAFGQRDGQICQFASLVQQRKKELGRTPGMEKFPAMLDTLSRMDPLLNCISAELGQLRSLTQGVLPQMRHIQCDGNGDWFAFDTLVRKAANMKLEY